jgi:hypothetical protein
VALSASHTPGIGFGIGAPKALVVFDDVVEPQLKK